MSKEKKISTDKKGLRVLTDKHDLHRLFGVETGPGKNDFARLWEEYQQDSRHQKLLEEKRKIVSNTRLLTVKERLKTYPSPQVELDLHGDTALLAEQRTEAFILNARNRMFRTIRIIVGKGLHSQGKAVLPDVIEKKIIQLKKQKCILSYLWEKKDKLKSGAIIVYLNPPD